MATMKTRRVLTGVAVALAVIVVAGVCGMVFLVRRPAIVPDLNQKSVAEATQALEQVKLTLGTSSNVATRAVGAGLIVGQNPAPKTSVVRRSSVDITVAVAPEELMLPNLVGSTSSTAMGTLSTALYLPVRVDVFGTQERTGTVIEQLPRAGTLWLTGRPVAIAVAAGPNDGSAVEVPDIIGKSASAATAALGQAGLGDAGFMVDVSDPAANVVTLQLPEGGEFVAPGTTVIFLMAAAP